MSSTVEWDVLEHLKMSPHSLLSVLVTHDPIGCLTKATTSFSWIALMLTLIQLLFSCPGLCKIKYTKTKDKKCDWCQPYNGATGNHVCLRFVSVSLSNLDQCSLASQMEPFLTPSLAKLFYNLPLYSAVSCQRVSEAEQCCPPAPFAF